MECPPLFRCPISMELMQDPVTIATGVTYERKNIEKWLFTCKKLTCPATMQRLTNFDLTPNHTLKRLISSWKKDQDPQTPNPPSPSSAMEHERLISLLATIDASPFKVSSLRKLHSVLIMEGSKDVQKDFINSGGIQALVRIMAENPQDFTTFRACEEALKVLDLLPLSSSVELISGPECMNRMMTMLQRGSLEARLHVLSILQKLSKTTHGHGWCHAVTDDLLKSLLELLSDEISTKLSSASLDVLLDTITASKKNRLKAIETGAVCIMIELLPDVGRHKCEKILLVIKRLCGLPEGRSAFAGHGLGVAVVTKKVLRVSELATKMGVEILWRVCRFLPTEKVLNDMMVFGAVKKLLGLLHVDGRSSTKEKAMETVKLHGGLWRQYPCFPCELKESCLRLVQG